MVWLGSLFIDTIIVLLLMGILVFIRKKKTFQYMFFSCLIRIALFVWDVFWDNKTKKKIEDSSPIKRASQLDKG